MLIYPAIDLIGGKCVRLRKGEFADATVYDVTPADSLQGYARAGAAWAHVVDLDGAKAGQPQQHELIVALAKDAPLAIQAAGGVRTLDHVQALLEGGVARVVVGSLAAEDPAAVAGWLDELGPDRLTLAFDVRFIGDLPFVAVKGWVETSDLTLWDALDRYPPGVLQHVLVTNVARDGAMAGPDVELIAAVAARRPDLAVQASGGVRSAADLTALKGIGADGAIVGRALYEGALDLREAIRAGA
jgi:phosphoribosylformimino-5-aminoimidazole carboxamide ribotide isomerase